VSDLLLAAITEVVSTVERLIRMGFRAIWRVLRRRPRDTEGSQQAE
jgi:hypothetical protein